MSKRDKRRAHLRQRVAFWINRLKVKPRRVRIAQMRRKWGSCSAGGTVTLADDLCRQSEGFQDFVIAHELLHLRIPNHSRMFKALMTAYLPRWRAYELARKHGASLR